MRIGGCLLGFISRTAPEIWVLSVLWCSPSGFYWFCGVPHLGFIGFVVFPIWVYCLLEGVLPLPVYPCYLPLPYYCYSITTTATLSLSDILTAAEVRYRQWRR